MYCHDENHYPQIHKKAFFVHSYPVKEGINKSKITLNCLPFLRIQYIITYKSITIRGAVFSARFLNFFILIIKNVAIAHTQRKIPTGGIFLCKVLNLALYSTL